MITKGHKPPHSMLEKYIDGNRFKPQPHYIWQWVQLSRIKFHIFQNGSHYIEEMNISWAAMERSSRGLLAAAHSLAFESRGWVRACPGDGAVEQAMRWGLQSVSRSQ